MARKKIKKKKSVIEWEGYMAQIQTETLLLISMVQKGMIPEGKVVVSVTKGEGGSAVIEVKFDMPGNIEALVEAEREKRKQ